MEKTLIGPISTELRNEFKELAKEKGMTYQGFLLYLVDLYKDYEPIKRRDK